MRISWRSSIEYSWSSQSNKRYRLIEPRGNMVDPDKLEAEVGRSDGVVEGKYLFSDGLFFLVFVAGLL